MNFKPNKDLPIEADCPSFLDRAQEAGFISARNVARLRAAARHLGPMAAGGLLAGGIGASLTFGLEIANEPANQPVLQHVVPGPEQPNGFAPRILEHPEPAPTQQQTHEITLHIR